MVSTRRRFECGFTLVEVMVAIAVIGIALPALLFSMMQQINNLERIRDKTVAQWLAANKLAEAQIANKQLNTIPKGKTTGTDTLLGREWFWTIESKRFPQKELQQLYGVQVEVRKDKKDEQALLTVFTVLRSTPPRPTQIGGGGGGGGAGG